jgi:tRNA-Thr(GGU) m(6)t(6)A37 methyltransferase TsaA
MFTIKPVAFVKNTRNDVSDDFWGGIVSEITLTDEFDESAFKGIEEFSHLEIIFCFNRVEDDNIRKSSHHPRNNPAWPEVGIFAMRGKNRPNKLGLSLVRLIELKGRTLFVKWLDAINGTPVLDIKPVIKEFLPEPGEQIIQPAWASELMRDYWK